MRKYQVEMQNRSVCVRVTAKNVPIGHKSGAGPWFCQMSLGRSRAWQQGGMPTGARSYVFFQSLFNARQPVVPASPELVEELLANAPSWAAELGNQCAERAV